jgi:hypothetical protein
MGDFTPKATAKAMNSHTAVPWVIAVEDSVA